MKMRKAWTAGFFIILGMIIFTVIFLTQKQKQLLYQPAYRQNVGTTTDEMTSIYDQTGADTGLVRDAHHVYCNQLFDERGAPKNKLTVIPFADPGTFASLATSSSTNPFFKDSRNVFIIACWAHGEYPPIRTISGADASTFSILGDSTTQDGNIGTGTYAKDNQRVYFIDNGIGALVVILGADPTTFVVVNGQYGYDARDQFRKFDQGQSVN